MFRFTRQCFSNALHQPTPFVEGALQLLKLHRAHQRAAADRHTVACAALEKEFLREVEAFRPCFTLTASTSVAPSYTQHVYRALQYFGLRDDPLLRQMDGLMGRAGLRHAARAASPFKGVRAVPAARQRAGGAVPDPLAEPEVTVLPTELPHPPRVDLEDPQRRVGAIKVPARYRGHWVLQEPEIAITRQERREDPW
ncbi:hypothetical protein STCU_02930 [Strigomonas culicis]|uniref:Uncharacterized protein n=1 Tax=Strigomonas culicis TaxID=28005 RepID=S9W8P2_9TRYP|nr:hypothetical protein STCU_02930 [Strigomonas culicis]|eukprot:EPY32200.1 hypothetical protein STCU_02930 [Strigomonas culicis]